ncbi:hypothetical protein [Alteromonas sp. ASW11-130]|nr:hypothetical protein [Alteromonas sp. ASW11-130]MCW8093190.1 hypothetical protein [Alteromonas sp. ASW11-130]
MDRWIDNIKPKKRKLKRVLKKALIAPENEVKRYHNQPRGVRSDAVFAR